MSGTEEDKEIATSSSIPRKDMKIAIGWAIIVDREDLCLNEKVKADEYYLKNMSFMFDLKIILMTFGLFRKTKGIY